jgi:hypothetical protein
MTDRPIDQLLNEAKQAIADGESSLKRAAECIAEAQSQGATQRRIAEWVGKSPAWVNQLLKWRNDGYEGTAFGTAKAEQRAAFRQSEQARVEEEARAEAEEARERAKHERKKEGARAQSGRGRSKYSSFRTSDLEREKLKFIAACTRF